MFARHLGRSIVLFCLGALGCNQPKPDAPTADFIRRHECSEGKVSTLKEGPERMRVTGCGQTEVYIHECANGSVQPPSRSELSVPPPIAEPRVTPQPSNIPNQVGCAWSREKRDPAANSLP
jgi:hypothetical protein